MFLMKWCRQMILGSCLVLIPFACKEQKGAAPGFNAMNPQNASNPIQNGAVVASDSAPPSDAVSTAKLPDEKLANISAKDKENTIGLYEYRDIFNSYAKNIYHFTDDQVSDLLYPPTKEIVSLLNDSKGTTPTRSLAEIRQTLKTVKPSDLRQESKHLPWKNQSLAELEASFSKSGPITLLLFPGVLSEIASLPAWNDVFAWQKDSSLTKKFEQKLAENKGNDKSMDTVYSTQKEGPELHVLSDMIKAASFDDANGKPLINFILFQPLFGSMESSSTIEENSAELLRRAGKVFALLEEPPGTIFLMGHSRGATVALEFLYEARKDTQKYTFANKIGGVVGCSGVIFGSDLADSPFPGETKSEDEKSFLQKMVEKLKILEKELQPFEEGDSDSIKRHKVAANSKAWASTGIHLSKDGLSLLVPPGSSAPGKRKEKLDTQIPNLGYLILTGKNYLFELVAANKFFSEYSANIRRYKDLSRRYIASFEGLSTAKRLEWWQTHPLPTDIKLISLGTTQYDITGPEQEPSPMLYKNYIVDADGTDYGVMRSSYYDMFERTGLQINDGLMPFDKAVMWPRLIKGFMPNFPVQNLYFAGVHSAHHYGIGGPAAYKSRDGVIDPFPRAVVLRALGTYLSRIVAEQK